MIKAALLTLCAIAVILGLVASCAPESKPCSVTVIRTYAPRGNRADVTIAQTYYGAWKDGACWIVLK